MVKRIVWCIMIYNALFYLSAINFLYHSYIGNIEMIDKSFQGLVLCGFINILYKIDQVNRR